MLGLEIHLSESVREVQYGFSYARRDRTRDLRGTSVGVKSPLCQIASRSRIRVIQYRLYKRNRGAGA